MIKSVRYVLKENFSNKYRIYSIAKYELLADMRDSKLGIFWNFAHPLIQVLTYAFVFGFIMARGDVKDVFGMKFHYTEWMLAGMVVWFYVSPCITNGCNAIYSKINVITKMKFPVSILPATIVLKELFNHFCIMIITIIYFIWIGIPISIYWLQIPYFIFCIMFFGISLSMVTSVLNMLARDTRKLILAIMRLLLYLTPILWPITRVSGIKVLEIIMKINPIYYLVMGYRDSFLYHKGMFSNAYFNSGIAFWIISITLFVIGSCMMYKFKHKLIDMI